MTTKACACATSQPHERPSGAVVCIGCGGLVTT